MEHTEAEVECAIGPARSRHEQKKIVNVPDSIGCILDVLDGT